MEGLEEAEKSELSGIFYNMDESKLRMEFKGGKKLEISFPKGKEEFLWNLYSGVSVESPLEESLENLIGAYYRGEYYKKDCELDVKLIEPGSNGAEEKVIFTFFCCPNNSTGKYFSNGTERELDADTGETLGKTPIADDLSIILPKITPIDKLVIKKYIHDIYSVKIKNIEEELKKTQISSEDIKSNERKYVKKYPTMLKTEGLVLHWKTRKKTPKDSFLYL